MLSRLAVVLALLVPSVAHAHFHLDAPASAYQQTTQGDPQKAFPCGPTAGAGVATGEATTVVAGGTLTLTVTETIFHPGHYRIALAATEGDLPAEPPVTVGATQCGSVPIDSAPTLPVLADGVLMHTAKFSGPQTVQIPIPADTPPCTDCVVQVLEWMSSHGAPCFYHHCARVNVLPAGSTLPDAGPMATPPDADPGTGPGGGSSSGGCAVSGGGATSLGVLLTLAVLLAGRRRVERR